jgi:hypothetical protein
MPVRLISVPWLIPAWAQAQVWGNFILIRRGVTVTEKLLAHELAHVRQWQTRGLVPFLWHYLTGLIRYGYQDHPLELEARAAEHNPSFLHDARQIISSS